MLKHFLSILIAAAAIVPCYGKSMSVDELSCQIPAGSYDARARFTVSMPQMADDVIYNVVLHQKPVADGDSLAPCKYLIEWEYANNDNASGGFSAYFDGHHYRFGGQKLQEYHREWDSIPFRPSILAGMKGAGVQRTAQFVDILPAFIGEHLRTIAKDSRYKITMHQDTVVSGVHRIGVDVVMELNGLTAMEGEYMFDKDTKRPVTVKLENNPGSISEQTIIVEYLDDAVNSPEEISETALIELYPEPFEKYRQSNFRVENLRGNKLPQFSVPTTTGERYTHESGAGFRAPTVLVFMESGQGFNSDLIAALRDAADSLPFGSDLIMAFTDSHIDGIEECAGQIREGEHLLMTARGLARDCGVASLPTVLLLDREGKVVDVIIGYNKDISSDVIQKMTLMNQ